MPKGFFDLEEIEITRGDEVIKNNVKKVTMSKEELEIYNFYVDKVTVITDIKEAIHAIKYISKNDFAFDYETTGKKPYRKGHRIFSASISNGKEAFSFPFFNDEEFRLAWKEAMLSEVKKICHNAKFESIWTKVILGYWPKNIIACTMINAHVINNRGKVGLKPLTKQYFNVGGYEEFIENFLKPDPKEEDKYGANAFNRIDKAPLNDLLLYGGLDSLFTYLLYKKQLKELDEHTSIGAKFFTEATLDLARVEYEGFPFDSEQAKKSFNEIDSKMKAIERDAYAMKEMKLWDKKTPFRFSAPADLAYILFDKLKYKVSDANKTATGKAKMDVDTLSKYRNKVKLVGKVLEWRKWKKVKDTYLASLTRENIDNKIHASIRLERVGTYRSSCDDPNLQNVPVRDEEVMNILRKCLISNRNCKLGEYDYKAMEAIINAVYNKDPEWLRYVNDASTDMHRDWAAEIYIRKTKDVLKSERQTTKSNFIFATTYGSYWKNTAVNLWNECDQESRDHLKECGIRNINDMREHMEQVENKFWDKFHVAFDFREKTLSDYEKKGYVELYTGFRCYAPMTRNQILNYPIQGTASHCKLWTLQQVSHKLIQKKMKSRILLEIHDSIIPNIYPEEEDYLDYIVWNYGTQKIREQFDWLIVPLFIEKKISKLNGCWAEMEVTGLLKGE